MKNLVSYLHENLLVLSGIIIALTALIYTIRLYYMKRGINVRCSYSFTSSIYLDDIYLSNLIMENRKDKSIVIFYIYLKLGNYYLELENFKGNPLIIKPFEVYSKEFAPVVFYSVSMSKINLNKLMDNRKVNKKIVIYTTEGIREIKAYINMKHPIAESFKNYCTAIVMPNRVEHDNIYYSKNIKFLINFINIHGVKETIYIRKDSINLKIKNLEINSNLINNKEKLENFLQDNIKNQKLKNIIDVDIIDIENEIKQMEKEYDKEIFEAKNLSFFEHCILCKSLTILKELQLKFKKYFRDKTVRK
ncbi:hypothetical protein NG776_02630 [Aliarcobacter cryaerophilus]|uniref:Uncharacterized protein n=4 Tax=Arcobacteraceae TaxID=2808963 RepID=A0ABX2YDP0_9BACT|nr:hypothetical protein [Arcobacter porcinus]OCL93112.1 hypothetical protein AAX28_00654 [Arcobacter porcinus]